MDSEKLERRRLSAKKWREKNKEKLKIWREKNKEIINSRSREWQRNNPEKAKINHKKYREANREKITLSAKIKKNENKEHYLEVRKKWKKQKIESDPIFKFSENIRSLISISIKKYSGKKRKKTESILGCNMDFFIQHILSKCPDGIDLKDFGKFGYHIDHIIPISSAKTEEEVLKLSHYTNFQPLFWLDNIKKSNKIIKK